MDVLSEASALISELTRDWPKDDIQTATRQHIKHSSLRRYWTAMNNPDVNTLPRSDAETGKSTDTLSESDNNSLSPIGLQTVSHSAHFQL